MFMKIKIQFYKPVVLNYRYNIIAFIKYSVFTSNLSNIQILSLSVFNVVLKIIECLIRISTWVIPILYSTALYFIVTKKNKQLLQFNLSDRKKFYFFTVVRSTYGI